MQPALQNAHWKFFLWCRLAACGRLVIGLELTPE